LKNIDLQALTQDGSANPLQAVAIIQPTRKNAKRYLLSFTLNLFSHNLQLKSFAYISSIHPSPGGVELINQSA
jgi:hypothetical protein